MLKKHIKVVYQTPNLEESSLESCSPLAGSPTGSISLEDMTETPINWD